jgi:hypothetical protein
MLALKIAIGDISRADAEALELLESVLEHFHLGDADCVQEFWYACGGMHLEAE